MHKITEPLRLATGSHKAGTGYGCVMNIISWENGDTVITDYPDCVDPVLAEIAQALNDVGCQHAKWLHPDDGSTCGKNEHMIAACMHTRFHVRVLCAECSMKVIEFGHELIGTGVVAAEGIRHRQGWRAIARRLVNYNPLDHKPGARACGRAVREEYIFPAGFTNLTIDQLIVRCRRVLAEYRQEFAAELVARQVESMPYKFEQAVGFMSVRTTTEDVEKIRAMV